jgi:hypothetical protein
MDSLAKLVVHVNPGHHLDGFSVHNVRAIAPLLYGAKCGLHEFS